MAKIKPTTGEHGCSHSWGLGKVGFCWAGSGSGGPPGNSVQGVFMPCGGEWTGTGLVMGTLFPQLSFEGWSWGKESQRGRVM